MLTENQISTDRVVKEYVNNLKSSIENDLDDVILYGSRARGDFKEFSDYDILVIHSKEKNSNTIQDAILEAEVKIMDLYDMLVSSILYTKEEWNKKKKYPLGLNIQREGISIWKKSQKLSKE